MTVKTRNEKYRPGISEAASCQAFRGSSGGTAACRSFLSHLPSCSEVLDKVGMAEQKHPAQEKTEDVWIPGDFHLPQEGFFPKPRPQG